MATTNYVKQAARANLAGLKKEWTALKERHKYAAPGEKKKLAEELEKLAQRLQTLQGQAK